MKKYAFLLLAPAMISSQAHAWAVKSLSSRLSDASDVIVVQNMRSVSTFRGAGHQVLGQANVSCETIVFTFSDIIGGPKNSVVALRAGSKPMQRGLLTVAPNLHGAYSTEAQARRFLNYVSGTSLLYGEIQSSTLGVTSFEVDLVGLGPAMRSAGMKCAPK